MDTSFVTREQSRLLRRALRVPLAFPVSALCQRTRPTAAGPPSGCGTSCRPWAALSSTSSRATGHPVVWAESPEVPGRPTLLIYGHYDVQPPDPLDEWVSPPFEPTVRDGRLYARGAADDKGQVFCLLKAYEAMLDADRPAAAQRPIHLRGRGGVRRARVIADLLRSEPERTRADAALVCDMSYYAPGWPAVYTALRGLCYAEISVRTLQRDLHSGIVRGRRPQRPRDAGAHPAPSSRAPTAKSRSPSCTRRSSRPPSTSSRPGSSCPSTRRSSCGRR